ncbi:A24 family peptidase [Sphingomonas lycopersici]|uniref:Prepilin peptidase n=1 Tax=Sphingomonas lycopersici TaxID=2951807 RepID=A0AA41ZDS7_9SPHN|nr:prepilin peptidase [Sphingomonas lycopersici]MCW6533878.1 prepilin peptidase [Sphingomonas lycopersici]
MTLLPAVSGALLIAAGVAASWGDLFRRTIPNWLCAATAIAGLALGFATGGAGMLGWHAAHAAIALVAGMLLFRIGLFGGGDAKFYAAVAAWFPLAAAPRLLISVALSGLALLVVWFVYRRATGKPISRNGDNPGDKLPYGIAIAIGALVARLALA